MDGRPHKMKSKKIYKASFLIVLLGIFVLSSVIFSIASSTSTNVKPLVDRYGFGSTTSSSYVGVAAITPVTSGKNITIPSLTITGAANTTWLEVTYGAMRFVINYADGTSAASKETTFADSDSPVSKNYTVTLPEGYGATIKNITLELKRSSGTGTVNGTISADGWETPS
jgi:hypothetical protein